MKILHAVEFYAPSHGGAQEVVRRISEAMVVRGHDVTVATTRIPARGFDRLNGVQIKEFALSGNSVRGIVGDSWEFQRYLVDSDFDLIMTYAAQQWTTDLLLDAAGSIRACTVCAPCGYSGLRTPEYARYFEDLPSRLARLDATIYHSPTYQDIEFARAHGLTSLHVIPNGAAEDEFGQLDSEVGRSFRDRHGITGSLILTVGTHTGLKGHRQAMAAFAASPIGPATLVVAAEGRRGAGCFDSCLRWARRLNRVMGPSDKQILVLELERPDVLAAYTAADLFLLLSLVECSPVVLFEAAASATPFLASDVGNSREIASWTQGGAVMPALRTRSGLRVGLPALTAYRMARMLRDRSGLERMGAAGRQAWWADFRWEVLAERYLGLYEDLVRAAGTDAPCEIAD